MPGPPELVCEVLSLAEAARAARLALAPGGAGMIVLNCQL